MGWRLADLITRTSEVPTVEPPKHTGTVWRPLLGTKVPGTTQFELVLGESQPGGEAHWHHHPDSEQGVYVLSGRAEVYVGDEQGVLEPGSAAFLPIGVPHRVLPVGTEVFRVLIVYAPPRQ